MLGDRNLDNDDIEYKYRRNGEKQLIKTCLLYTSPGQIVANAKLYRTLSALVNIFRSIPFIILLVWMIPFTRVIVGTRCV